MKRLNILTKPTKLADVKDMDSDDYTDKWLFKVEKIQAKKLRSFKRHLASS